MGILTREIKVLKDEFTKTHKSINSQDLITIASARITHSSPKTKNSTIISLNKTVSPLFLTKNQEFMIKSISEIYGQKKQFIKLGNCLLVTNTKISKKWNYFHSYGLYGIRTSNLIRGYKRNELTPGRHSTILSGDLYWPFFNEVTGTLSIDIGFGLGDSKGNPHILFVINDQMKV